MNETRRIERELLAELTARNVVVTDLKRRQGREVAGDMALVERLRDQINSGAALDLDAFMKLKANSAASKADLFVWTPEPMVNKLEIELIATDTTIQRLREQNAEL